MVDKSDAWLRKKLDLPPAGTPQEEPASEKKKGKKKTAKAN